MHHPTNLKFGLSLVMILLCSIFFTLPCHAFITGKSTVTAANYKPIKKENYDDVRIYYSTTPYQSYRVIGTVMVKGSKRSETIQMVNAFKKHAAKIGADAIIHVKDNVVTLSEFPKDTPPTMMGKAIVFQ